MRRPLTSSSQRKTFDPYSVLSIGALSRATGVPVETLRTWERRYGFPVPVDRPESGHRRYPLESVERLRLVVRAMDQGHKPSIVLPATIATLHDLLALGDGGGSENTGRGGTRATPSARGSFVDRTLAHVRKLDSDALLFELERAWNDVGAMDFLVTCLSPFLRSLGESWHRGEIEVGHEHFASEHIREFLSSRWRPMNTRADGPRIVCASPPGEQHVLGLHMVAMTLCLMAGASVIFLGANTPVEDIVVAVREQGSDAVALSAAEGVNRKLLDREIKALLRALPKDIPVIAGGAGFDPPPPGVLFRSDLTELAGWARRLARPGS